MLALFSLLAACTHTIDKKSVKEPQINPVEINKDFSLDPEGSHPLDRFLAGEEMDPCYKVYPSKESSEEHSAGLLCCHEKEKGDDFYLIPESVNLKTCCPSQTHYLHGPSIKSVEYSYGDNKELFKLKVTKNNGQLILYQD